MLYIDSHLHLGDYSNSAPILDFARNSGTLLVTAGVDETTSLRGMALARNSPSLVEAFVGVHPSEASKETPGDWFSLALREASGVGEIGLDPKYPGEFETQERTFRNQLELAEKRGKPVQVHSRGAERYCLDTLGTFTLTAVLMHWFEGEELVRLASDRGYYVSFGPAILVSKKLQRMAVMWARDRILAESDGPVPFSALGGAQGPALIPSVVFRLAMLLGGDFEESVALVRENSLRFLSSKH